MRSCCQGICSGLRAGSEGQSGFSSRCQSLLTGRFMALSDPGGTPVALGYSTLCYPLSYPLRREPGTPPSVGLEAEDGTTSNPRLFWGFPCLPCLLPKFPGAVSCQGALGSQVTLPGHCWQRWGDCAASPAPHKCRETWWEVDSHPKSYDWPHWVLWLKILCHKGPFCCWAPQQAMPGTNSSRQPAFSSPGE